MKRPTGYRHFWNDSDARQKVLSLAMATDVPLIKKAYSGLGGREVEQCITHTIMNMNDLCVNVVGSSLDFQTTFHRTQLFDPLLICVIPPLTILFPLHSSGFAFGHASCGVVLSQLSSKSHQTCFRRLMPLFVLDVPSQ